MGFLDSVKFNLERPKRKKQVLHAMEEEMYDEVENLLKIDPKLINTVVDKDGLYLIHTFCCFQITKHLDMLKSFGVNVNQVAAEGDISGYTPLHFMAESGASISVQWLVENEADVNCISIDLFRCSPLHLAAHNGHLDIVDTLLSNGADVNLRDNHDSTPLNLAKKNGHALIEQCLTLHGGGL